MFTLYNKKYFFIFFLSVSCISYADQASNPNFFRINVQSKNCEKRN